MGTKAFRFILFGLLAGVVAGVRPAWAQIKVYLKDGSYQLVKSYEIKGDRVRYYSLERSEWEEVPRSLVDFEATKRAEQQEKAEQHKELQQAREIESERFEKPADTGFQIQPGIRLPTDAGVYAFDGAQVLRLAQTPAQVVTDKKRKALLLALPGPILKGQSLVMLEGPKAAVRFSTSQPVFFVEAADGWGARADLIPLEVRKDKRLVEKIQSGLGLGPSGEQRQTIPLERTQVAPGIFKLQATQPLKPGEYAIGELLDSQKLNLDVWDFGVDAPSDATPAKR